MAVGLAAVACSTTPAEDDSGQTEDAVQGGTVDTKHTFAVGVQLANSAVCSGVLIAPNLVMTAQHCVSSSTGGKYVDCQKDQFASAPVDAPDVTITTDARLPGRKQSQYKVAHVVVPESRELCGADIALLVLSKNVPANEAKPATPQLQAMTKDRSLSGKIAAIGFGLSAATKSDAGERRIKEDIPISCVPGGAKDCDGKNGRKPGDSAREFRTTGGVCQGDSGSGAFEQSTLDENNPKVLGILSRVTNRGSACTDGVYTRTDMYATLILAAGIKAAQVGKYPTPAWAKDAGNGGGADDVQQVFEGQDEEPSTPTDGDPGTEAPPSTPPRDGQQKKGGFFGDLDWGKVIDILGGLIPKLTGSDDGKPREDNKSGAPGTHADAGADSGVGTAPSPQSDLPKPAGGDRATSESDDSASSSEDDSTNEDDKEPTAKKKKVDSGGCSLVSASSSSTSASAALGTLGFALLAARGLRRRRKD